MSKLNYPKRGGYRPGSGAKKKEPTMTLSYRVPVRLSAKINEKCKAIITKMKKAKQ